MINGRQKKTGGDYWLDSVRDELEEWIADSEDEDIRRLSALRQSVLDRQGEDIITELYIYDARVFLSEIGEDIRCQFEDATGLAMYSHPIGWETIRRFPHVGPDGREAYVEIDKRTAKLLFLRAWLEVAQWKKGEKTSTGEPAPFLLPDSLEWTGVAENSMDHFLFGESAELSHDMMLKYHDRWLSPAPEKRDARPRFYNARKRVHQKADFWVFAPSDLWRYYYDGYNAVDTPSSKLTDVVSRSFPPANGEWKTINCLRKTEMRHAATANFISWQEWLHAVKSHEENPMKGKNQQDRHKNSRSHTGFSEADDDPFYMEIQNIIRRISLETGVKGLTADETDLLKKACADSPRIRQLRRMAHIHHTRAAMGKALARVKEETTEMSPAAVALSRRKTTIDQEKVMGSTKSSAMDHATRWKRWIASKPWRFVQAFGVAAVTTCLIIWLALPEAASRLEKMIVQSYQAANFQQAQLAKNHYELPWEMPLSDYGFATPAEPTNAARAFGAGLWTGRQLLQKTKYTTPMPNFLTTALQKSPSMAEAWPDTTWNAYYQMGKWCFLVYAVSHGGYPAPAPFWKDQAEIVEKLQEAYSEATHKGTESSEVVEASLNSLKSKFAVLKEKNSKSTKKVAFEIRNLIIYLSPGFPAGR